MASSSASTTTVDVNSVWNDFHTARGTSSAGSFATFGASLDTSSNVVNGSDISKSASKSSVDRAKKARKTTRAASMTYIKAGGHMDVFLLMYYLQKQLDAAKRLFDDRTANLMSIHQMSEVLSVRMYMPHDLCDMKCKIETVPIAVYAIVVDNPQLFEKARNVAHMFLSTDAASSWSRYGIVLHTDVEHTLIHICSDYCPYQIRLRRPELFGRGGGQSQAGDDDDDGDEVDQDSFWADQRWHINPTKLTDISSPVYFCVNHYRFHVCNALCDSTIRIGHANVCPISRNEVTNIAFHQFGDGVGTAEQMDKTEENKGQNTDAEGLRRRRRSTSIRTAVFNAATTVDKNGLRTRRLPGSRATSKRRLAGRARRVTSASKQTPVQVTLTAEQLEENGCKVPPGRQSVTVEAIPHPPFSERKEGIDDAAFLLDSLKTVEMRPIRRKRYMLPMHLHSQAYASDPNLFAITCEEVASVFYRLIVGAQRRAINESKLSRAKMAAEKAVDQYKQQCIKNRKPWFITNCEIIYETTMKKETRIYPVVDLSPNLYEALETHYTLQVVLFYMCFLAAPIRGRGVLSPEVEDTVGTGFALGHFAVVILDLMRTGLVVDNVVIFRRDTFLLEYFPESPDIKKLGMLEKTCTYIKGLIMTYIRAMRSHGVSLLYLRATSLSVEQLAQASYADDPGAEVVQMFTMQRIDDLREISTVEPPSPLRDIE